MCRAFIICIVIIMKKKHKKIYPWQSPIRLLLFSLALIIATYLTINMPTMQKTKWVYDNETKSMQEIIVHKKNQSELNISGQKSPENQDNQKNIEKNNQKRDEKSGFEKIVAKIKSLSRLFIMVAIAAFLGGLMEARSWHIFFGYFLRKVTKAARLPEVIGISMPIALYSGTSANTILVSSHAQGEISTSALITGGMANSYFSHVSHSMRVLYPVVAIIGLPGLLYFGIQFLGGFLIILFAFTLNRYKFRHQNMADWKSEISESHKKVLSWAKSIKLGLLRSLTLLFRMVYMTIPLMLGMEWLLKSGAFNFWEQYIPAHVAQYFPAELISVIVAQIGGLVQSAAVSSNLYAEGLIHQSQILLAMLIASAVGNPIRTLRRNLPTALGVFPPKVAFSIVFIMQFARFLVTLFGSIGVILWMKYFLFG